MIFQTRRDFLKHTLGVAMLTSAELSLASQFTRPTIRSILRGGARTVASVPLRHKDKLQTLYAARNYQPLWSDRGGFTEACRAIIKNLEGADFVGLDPATYYTRVLYSWAYTPDRYSTVNLDLLLTDCLCEYFDNIANGVNIEPGISSHHTDIEPNIASFFNGQQTFVETIHSIEPHHQRYADLLNALHYHQKLQQMGGWQSLDHGPTLKEGSAGTRVLQLRTRLIQSGDISTSNTGTSYQFDSTLKDGVISFQTRHNLTPDGTVGTKTASALNVPLELRIEQLKINLDRWRKLPAYLGSDHIVVNTAGFDMHVTLGGNTEVIMDVIVGKIGKPTPIFSEQMEYLVINPSWYVPRSIAREVLLPKERKSPGYIDQNNFVARSLANGSETLVSKLPSDELQSDIFLSKYILRQLPSPSNALGEVKFMMPNNRQIYLHDTNSKHLFSQNKRAFSHGCVRVSEPHLLTSTLLSHSGYSAHEIESAFASKTTKTIRLENSIPVHLTYQTSWVDEAGKVHFREDIYGHDALVGRNSSYARVSQSNDESRFIKQLSTTGVQVAFGNGVAVDF